MHDHMSVTRTTGRGSPDSDSRDSEPIYSSSLGKSVVSYVHRCTYPRLIKPFESGRNASEYSNFLAERILRDTRWFLSDFTDLATAIGLQLHLYSQSQSSVFSERLP